MVAPHGGHRARSGRETVKRLGTASVLCLLLAAGAAGGEDPAVERGRRVYQAQRCRVCHAIGGAGNPRSPLDGVGARLSADDIRRWIVAPEAMQPGVRKRAYELPPDDLEALVAYLVSLR
jgi:mono/diheme cytochrome c family protein